MAEEAFNRLDTLLQVGLRIARAAPTGRIALASAYAAIECDWIPRPWGDSLVAELEAAAAAAAEPIATKDVEKILRGAWDARPTDVLDELEADPVATSPSSQVHRGVLDGAPVAVKVLKPGLAASVRQDLALLDGLLAPLDAAFPAVNAKALMQEVRERVLDELDLEHEATMQRRFHRALRSHPFLLVPAPVTRLAHEQVLVSEWIDGVPLWQAPDPDQAAARLLAFVLGAGRAGLAHADPQPDDVLVKPDGRLAILDFGATRTVDPKRSDRAAAAVEAVAAQDEQAFGEALGALGLLPAQHAATALALATHALGELGGAEPTRLDSAAVIAARDRLFQRPAEIAELILAGSIDPQDLWPLRGHAQLFATIARVGANGAWRDLALQALGQGWGG
jgi:predicted unusual protein kinase regulating ubiquinone biosynthesis (AarF/ABC1/UbiB family)